MHLSLSILFIFCSISFTQNSPDDIDFPGFDNLEDPLFSDVSDYQSSNAAFDPWDVSNDGDIFNQASNDNTNIDMFSPINDDDTNTDLFAAGCSTNDRLGARDGGTNCPNSAGQLKTPELPSLDKLEEITLPSTPQNQGSDDRSEATSLTVPKNNGICPLLQPIHLCCLCEAQFQFTYCQDCLPSESFFVLLKKVPSEMLIPFHHFRFANGFKKIFKTERKT